MKKLWFWLLTAVTLVSASGCLFVDHHDRDRDHHWHDYDHEHWDHEH